MAKNRYAGKSGQIHVDPAGGSSYSQILLARQIQLPPRTRASIDVTAMEDTSAQSVPGIAEESEFSFEILWDDEETTDEALATLYSSGAIATWKAVITDGTSTWTQSWSGYVSGLEPQAFGGNDPVTLRVTGLRTGAITDAFT